MLDLEEASKREMRYDYDLLLTEETRQEVEEIFVPAKEAMEIGGLRVNMEKTRLSCIKILLICAQQKLL